MPKPLTAERIREAMLRANCNWQDAAALLCVPVATMRTRIKRLRAEGHEIPGPRGHINRIEAQYEPTLEEIAAACEAIQAGWSRRERMMRMMDRPPPWMPPVVELEDDTREEIW